MPRKNGPLRNAAQFFRAMPRPPPPPRRHEEESASADAAASGADAASGAVQGQGATYQLTIKVPRALNGWDTGVVAFQPPTAITFTTPIVLPESMLPVAPAGSQSPDQDEKVVNVGCEIDANMLVVVDNTCMWACDLVSVDSHNGGFLMRTPERHNIHRTCPHCGIRGDDDKKVRDMATDLATKTANKWIRAWLRIQTWDEALRYANETDNRRRRRNKQQQQQQQQQRKTAAALEECWLCSWGDQQVNATRPPQPPIIIMGVAEQQGDTGHEDEDGKRSVHTCGGESPRR